MWAVVCVCHHRVRRDDNTTLPRKLRDNQCKSYTMVSIQRACLLFLIGRENSNLLLGDVRPLHKLLFPLHDGHAKRTSVKRMLRLDAQTNEEVANTRQDFFMVHAAVMPTRVLPAPQGRTIIPDRARLHVTVSSDIALTPRAAYPLPNILLRLVSWYGRIVVDGLRSISRFAFIVSFLKSYSSSMGYSSSLHLFLTS